MLIRFTLVSFYLIVSAICLAQIKAVTETGDQVILSSNGTWRYVEEAKNADSILLNPVAYSKAAAASFLLKSKKANAGVWLDPKKWNFEKDTDGGASEYSFSLKENSSVGATIIVEPIEMELQALVQFAMKNIQDVASTYKIVHEEYRTVNGLKMVSIELEATVQGLQITYFNYYFSDTSVAVQFLGFIPRKSVGKYRKELEDFLNGLVVINDKSKSVAGGDDNTAMHSLLIEGSNCRKYFTGNWNYVANGKKYTDRIMGNIMRETNNADSFSSEYKITWLDNCRYQLTLLRTNDPAAGIYKIGTTVSIEILEISEEHIRYKSTYGKLKHTGEMSREG